MLMMFNFVLGQSKLDQAKLMESAESDVNLGLLFLIPAAFFIGRGLLKYRKAKRMK